MIFLDEKDNVAGSHEHYYLGDFHSFVAGYPIRTLKEQLRMISTKKNATFSLGGDNTDSMNPLDPRWKIEQYDPGMQKSDQQIDALLELLDPIADRCLWVLAGNHEQRVWNITDIAKRLAEGLGCNCYDGYKCSNISAKVDFGSYKVLDGHWEWYISSAANDDQVAWENERRALKKKCRNVGGVHDCEAVVEHHIHKIHMVGPSSKNFMKLISYNGKLKSLYPHVEKIWIDKKKGQYYYHQDDRWYGSSGGFMPGYVEGISTYVEKKGYKPTEMGCVKAVVKNNKFRGLEEVKL